jgi:hypothetical protein
MKGYGNDLIPTPQTVENDRVNNESSISTIACLGGCGAANDDVETGKR